MRFRRCLALVLCALVTASTGAEAQAPQERLRTESYHSPEGLVEVIGLRRWSLAMLRDSVRARRPGMELHDAACMIVLRDSLGFPDVLVSEMIYLAQPGAQPQRFLVLKVVEPRDSSRVQWRRASVDSFQVLRPSYSPLIMGATDSAGQFQVGRLLFPLQYAAAPQRLAAVLERMPAERRADAETDAKRLQEFLASQRTENDWRMALNAIRYDGAYANRVAAAVVLANFADRDSSWLALTEALRDGNEAVRSTSLTVLQTLSPHPIEWKSSVPTLRALLGGTNVQASEAVFSMLARTSVSPALAAPLLGRNEQWALAHLQAKHPGAAESAHSLLVRLNGGEDLGRRAEDWERRLLQLTAPVP